MIHTLRTSRQAYTLVELLISLALLAVLFTLLGSLLHGMARIARLAENTSVREREIAFCFEMIRKELGEIVVDQARTDFNFVSGENFIAYTTTRRELLARNSIPGGVKRIEWRYDPGAQTLVRRVAMLIDGRREASPPVETRFLEGLQSFEIMVFNRPEWLRMTGISQLVPVTGSIAIRLGFASENRTNEKDFFESAFILPDKNIFRQ